MRNEKNEKMRNEKNEKMRNEGFCAANFSFSHFLILSFNDYKFGLILLHSEMGGTMFSVTSSSRILQRCS